MNDILKRLESQRDTFDARYETSRYEDMIVFGDFTATEERDK